MAVCELDTTLTRREGPKITIQRVFITYTEQEPAITSPSACFIKKKKSPAADNIFVHGITGNPYKTPLMDSSTTMFGIKWVKLESD